MPIASSFCQLFYAAVVLLVFACCAVPAQQSLATLRGRVADEFGGLVVGAVVTIADQNGVEKTATTDGEGKYVFAGLAPGRYTLRASASGFAPYENPAVDVAAGINAPIDITLNVAIEQVEVTVSTDTPITTEAENNAGAVVLRGSDLEALPDDPDDLAEALQALAGPSSGLNGGDTFIDGFTGGRLPPKESIREVRINRNPFSAEYDRLGFGRIEIFTKPGTDRFRGQAFFNFNDESLNSRSPFAPARAPFQSRRYGGNISGPLSAKRASFFLDVERREEDDNATVRAIILDPALNIVPFNAVILNPDRRTTFSPRLDYQLNSTNTMVARYSYSRSHTENAGVGDFNLPSRAYDTATTQHTFQLTETAVINQKIINETRFQFVRQRRQQEGLNALPTIRVSEAFTGGGSQIRLSLNDQDRYELQNYTSWTTGNHGLKAGARLRGIKIKDNAPQNFGGTYTFSGGAGPQLDSNNQIVLDATGQPILISLTSIERYRRTLLFLEQGLSPTAVRLRGGGATQFSISGGDPEAQVMQWDFSPFVQDDWRLRPNFTLSLGLRYETQTNISDLTNFAPRIAFAWSPGSGSAARQPTTVVRGGLGFFYDRVSENLTLQSNRSSGDEQQFIVSSSLPNGTAVLDRFPNIPSIAELAAFNIPRTTRRVADDLRAPYTMQASISVERQLPHNMTVSATYIAARTIHVLRSRNINAPLPGTVVPGVPGSGVRPFANVGNIFQYESSGRFNQNQFILNVNNRLSRNITLFANYVFNRANSDSDGTNSFPVNQYDLRGEYGRAAVDVRHRFFLGGSLNVLPWQIRMSPFVVLNSGRPFNITTGRDTNGDALFTERPAFATDLSKSGLVSTPFGIFDPNPTADQVIIPRNFGTGPSFFTVNLRLSRSFGFGEEVSASGPAGGGGRGGGGGGRGGGGRGGGGGGAFGDAPGGGKRYNLTFSINVQNLLNHTNLGTPIGNLTSPLFGQSNTSAGGFGFGGGQAAGNRRVELQLRFTF